MLAKICGLGLIIVSIYFLGQDIHFATHTYYNWWQKIPAAGSIISLMLGIVSLTLWRQTMGNFGWIFIAIGIILVFLSSGVILQPTSLWKFLVAMLAFVSGYQLLSSGKIRL
jgi:hypothetical protein